MRLRRSSLRAKRSNPARHRSPPPCGEGLGLGVVVSREAEVPRRTPLPDPPPQGGREQSATARRSFIHRLACCLSLLLTLAAAAPAQAHPHVWVSATSELLYREDGSIVGVRHAWTFDEMF